MKFIEDLTMYGLGRRYLLELDSNETLPTNLDNFDMMLIRKCGVSNSIADKLLALECIVRRIEQANGNNMEASKLKLTAKGRNFEQSQGK